MHSSISSEKTVESHPIDITQLLLNQALRTPQPRAAGAAAPPTPVAGREPGTGRPTKADRRAINRLRGEDEGA